MPQPLSVVQEQEPPLAPSRYERLAAAQDEDAKRLSAWLLDSTGDRLQPSHEARRLERAVILARKEAAVAARCCPEGSRNGGTE
jgi:hypothetical protein